MLKEDSGTKYIGPKYARLYPTNVLSTDIPYIPLESFMTEKDPNGIDQHAPGAKVDAGKLQPWLFFSGFARALEDVALVTTKGAEKYTRNGWVVVPNGEERYMEAFMRHSLAYAKGEIYDNGPGGTGCTHMSQMIWNLLAVHELALRKNKE